MNNKLQPGHVLPFVAAAALSAGDPVVIGNIIGVVQNDVAIGETGQAHVNGVFRLPKVSGAVIAQGQSLVFDISANSGIGAFDDNAATPAAGDISGAAAFAWEAAGDGATTLLVKLTGVPGTVA